MRLSIGQRVTNRNGAARRVVAIAYQVKNGAVASQVVRTVSEFDYGRGRMTPTHNWRWSANYRPR